MKDVFNTVIFIMKEEKRMKKKILSAALFSALVSSALGVVTAGAVYEIDEVTVTADREGNVAVLPGGLVNQTAKLGILGNKSVMDIPYSEMSMTEKTLETFSDPSQPLANVLQNNPSIRSSTSSPMYTDFSMRGINMNGNHMMLNGIPSLFYQFNGPPNHIIERMDITSGPNAGVNGVSMSNNGTNGGATPAPGTINIVTKKAGQTPVLNYTQTFSGRSSFGEFIDVSRRTGANGEWGVRVMGEYMDGDLALRHAEKEEKNIFINLDRKGETSVTNIFAGSFDLRVNKGQRWFTYGGKSDVLPSAPDSNTDYDFDGTTKWMHGWLLTLNHEKELSDNWSWFVNWGVNRRSGNKYNSSSALKFDEKGNFMSSNVSNAQNEIGTNSYFQTGIKGKFATGAVEHHVSLAFDRSGARYWNDTNNSVKGNITGSLYDGTAYKNSFYIPQLRKAKLSWSEINTGITLADSLTYGKWDVLLAVSRKHEHFRNEIKGQLIRNDDWLPTFGITYKANDHLSFYAGQTESLSRGGVVSNDSKYINQGETLAPSVSRQKEIGVKYKYGGLLTTLSYFYIDQENIIDIDVGSGKYRRAADGRDKFKGVEWTVNGKLAPKWTVTGGLMYIDAKRDKTQGGKNDGRFVNGVADWSGVLGLVYEPNDSLGIIGRVIWNDAAYIDNSNASSGKTKIPSYTTFDLGVNYKTRLGRIPVSLSAMCYNVANKDYWMGRGSSTTFGLSMPRTFMLSARFEF